MIHVVFLSSFLIQIGGDLQAVFNGGDIKVFNYLQSHVISLCLLTLTWSTLPAYHLPYKPVLKLMNRVVTQPVTSVYKDTWCNEK